MKVKIFLYSSIVAIIAFGLTAASLAEHPRFDPKAGGPPVRDPQALGIVEEVVSVLGGKQAQLAVHTSALSGTFVIADSQSSGTFIWEDDFSGAKPEFRKELNDGRTVRVFVSGHGTPAASRDGKSRQLRDHASLVSPLYLPGVTLATILRNQHYSIRLVADTSGLAHIRTSWDLNPATAFITQQDWYFDAASRLPVRVEYRVADTENAARAQAASMEFSDFHSVTGIQIPFHIVGHGPDGQTRTFIVTQAETNIAISRNRFETDGGQQ